MSCEAWPCTTHPPTQVPDTQLQYNCLHGSVYLKYPSTERTESFVRDCCLKGEDRCGWKKTSLLFSCDYLTCTLRWIYPIMLIVSGIILHIELKNYICNYNMTKKRFMLQILWESCCIYWNRTSASSGKNSIFTPHSQRCECFTPPGWKKAPMLYLLEAAE